MNTIDLVVLSFTLIFIIRGIFRGFIFELTTVIGLFLGYLVAITYLDIISTTIAAYLPSIPTSVINIVSFGVLFIVTNIALRFVAGVMTKTIKFAMLGWLNRLLGGLLGGVKSLLILSILVFLFHFLPFSATLAQNENIKGSYLYPLLQAVGPQLYDRIKEFSDTI